MIMPNLNVVRTNDASEETNVSWPDYLKSLIDFDNWRSSEFDSKSLVFIPDVKNPRTSVKECDRSGCTVLLSTGVLCPGCRNELKKLNLDAEVSIDQFIATTRPDRKITLPGPCRVSNCARRKYYIGLCASHASTYRLHSSKHRGKTTVTHWLKVRKETPPLQPVPSCEVEACPYDGQVSSTMCPKHQERFKKAAQGRPWMTKDIWMETVAEPYADANLSSNFAALAATPFDRLREPLRWELLYALQQRDLEGRASLHAFPLRSLYLKLRAESVTTVVGESLCAWNRPAHSNMRGFLKSIQWYIDEAHRKYLGSENQDPRIVPYRDLTLRTRRSTPYKTPVMDLTSISRDWIADTVIAWAKAGPRSPAQLGEVQRAWKILDAVIPPDRQEPQEFSGADMDNVVRTLFKSSNSPAVQKRLLRAISSVIDYGRADHKSRKTWDNIPPGFSINPILHRPGPRVKNDTYMDEPFRYVPQPIIDWTMDHLNLLTYSSEYKTVEARVMVYLNERCGRRPIETVSLLDNCISYDSDGEPYLEWRQGKPPYGKGIRLPIHQETHDAIRVWQETKRAHGVTSQWLFPSSAWAAKDQHYEPSVVQMRVKRLVSTVATKAPFVGTVEGAEGNLIHFKIESIDAYSFRHAFAQRLADAVDESGRSTTPPDVLQSYMGHKSFKTTMGYYEVTAKRRRRVLNSLAARKLDIHGKAVEAAAERDPYRRVGLDIGSCTEPQNVATSGRSCALNHACESCPFFLVDPLDREGIVAKRSHLEVQRERAALINSPQYFLDFLQQRIADCDSVVHGIDRYVQQLPLKQRQELVNTIERLAEVRRRATAPRMLDLRALLTAS